MVVFNEGGHWDWTRISVGSFREHFPDHPLIVVDHNNNAPEREFILSSGALLLDNPGKHTHGGGMDHALRWCLDNGHDVMVHFEPDCLITGRKWYDNLLEAIEDGYWMAGTVRIPFGPIHPCPSAWLCKTISRSFHVHHKGDDYLHPNYAHVIDNVDLTNWLNRVPPDWTHAEWYDFWVNHWDAGGKNWFEAAVEGRAELVNGDGIHHYWYGRKRGPENYPELIPLL